MLRFVWNKLPHESFDYADCVIVGLVRVRMASTNGMAKECWRVWTTIVWRSVSGLLRYGDEVEFDSDEVDYDMLVQGVDASQWTGSIKSLAKHWTTSIRIGRHVTSY